MKWFALSLIACSMAFAQETPGNDSFETEALGVRDDIVYIVSSFDERDYFSAFSQSGMMLWEIPFTSKVVSWKIDGDFLYIFSKNRNGRVTYLSCFDREDGKWKWENPIFAPKSTGAMTTPAEEPREQEAEMEEEESSEETT